MKDNEVVELLEILIDRGFKESLENGFFGDFYNIAKGDELLEYMLSYSNAETVLNTQLNEANQWIICQFENEQLRFDDRINQLIIESGLEHNQIVNMTYLNQTLSIKTDTFTSESMWSCDDIPNDIIEKYNNSLKEQLIRSIVEIEDITIIKSLIKKTEKLTNK